MVQPTGRLPECDAGTVLAIAGADGSESNHWAQGKPSLNGGRVLQGEKN